MKKLVIAVALGLVFNTGLIAGTIGGERPDRSPSWVGSFVNKIENLIIEKAAEGKFIPSFDALAQLRRAS